MEQTTQERIDYLKKRIMTLEWDKSHNQLNAGMEEKFNSYKKEFEILSKPEEAEAEN